MGRDNKTDINTYIPSILFIITILSRIPFTSKFLFHGDSVHFALALEKYDITTHQPHPPGYFLYVMLGRLLNLLINDANTIFITISIVFSCLTVVAIYYLGKEMLDRKTGVIASLLAITSPNIWFHGEVALTYIVEAFFSTLIAFLCWKIYKGSRQEEVDKYLYLSAIALGIAGGIRQNTLVFLLPLWLFSIKGLPLRKIIISFMLLAITSLLWFIPMIQMTGGYDVYREAFKELWLFNTGNVSVFHRGWDSFKMFSSTLYNFIFYGLGVGIIIILFTCYSIVRHKRLKLLNKSKLIFFMLWILPSFMFHLLIFTHNSNPGYVLIFLPAFLIIATLSIIYISEDLKKFLNKDFLLKVVIFVISINAILFLFINHPASYRAIKTHDKDLSIMLKEIKNYESSKVAIFVDPYTFYGYRHIMYYLPEYKVYQVDIRVAPTGEIRKIFWGVNRKTFLTDKIVLPENIKGFVAITISDDKDKVTGIDGINIKKLPETEIYIASGPISLIKEIYPELGIKL